MKRMMKAIKALVALFAFALTGAAVADTWEEPGTGITWTYEVDDGEVYIGDGDGCAVDPKPSGVVKIPATIYGRDVVAISDYAFEGCDEITKVVVPIGVRSIGDYAFSTGDEDTYPYCTALTLVTIPSSVEYIGTCAFYGCTAMADENGFVIVNGVLYQYTGSAASVTVPAGVKEIGDSAFSDCDFITSVTLPNGLVRIGEDAFYQCSELASVTIPDTVTEIVDGAFSKCWAMADANGFVIVRSVLHCYDSSKPGVDIKIPSGVTRICPLAFFNNTGIRSVTIPYGVNMIGSMAFYNCSSLTDVEIPESVERIGRNAFNNSGLSKVYVVPDDTDRVRGLIDDSNFPNADSLVFEEDVTPSEEYRTETVGGIEWKYHIVDGGAEIYNDEDAPAIPIATSGAITVPSTLGGFPVVRIGANAFDGCDELTAVTIPASVREIGAYAFYNCNAMSSVALPVGLQIIDDSAFDYCVSLSDISIPDSVDYIGDSAFHGCESMADASGFVVVRGVLHYYAGSDANVTVPSGVKVISPSAFDFNSTLTSVTIPDGVTEIGSLAFNGCRNLASVEIADSVESIGSGAFSGCSSMADANGFVVVRRVLYYYAGSAANVEVPYGVQTISSRAFAQNEAITSVSIPSGVKTIEGTVFGRCKNLESVSIHSSVTRIGLNAFVETKLATVHVESASEVDRVRSLITASKYKGSLSFYTDLMPATICTVTFDADGGTCDPSSIQCVYSQPIGELPVAYKSGYTFTGWYTFKGSGGVQLTPETHVDGNKTYYAQYTENPPEYFTETVGGVAWKYIVVDGKATITYGTQSAVPTTTAGEITVPATLGGYPVTVIGDYAFYQCASITKLTVPSGVTGFGTYVFHSAASLKDMFVPKTVTDFRGLTFVTCSIDTIHVEKGDIDRVRTLIEAVGIYSFDYDDGSAPPAPANDMFANATTISGASGSVSGSNVGATLETDEPLPKFGNCQHSVWWTWKAPANGKVTFDTVGSAFDTFLGAYTGDAVASLTTMAENDDISGDVHQSRVSFSVVKDTTYRIAVAGYQDNAGDITLNWSFAVPTTFTVTFNVNGGDSVSEASRVVESGAAIGALPTAEWAGHKLEGWYTDSVVGDQIDASTTVSGNVTYFAHWTELAPPANDMFANATEISGVSGSVSGSNVDATVETGEPLPKFSSCQSSVWWTWTAPASGTVTFDTVGSAFDTLMGAYTGDAVASLTTMAENDDISSEVRQSSVSFSVVKDTTYRIAVAGYQAFAGDITLNWSLSVPPSVIVTFDGNGGDSDEPTRELPSGSAIGTLPGASWSGHTLVGWFTESTGGDQISASTTVSGNVTYYAHWTEDALPDYATILGAPAGMTFASSGDKTWVDGGTVDGKAAVKSGDIGDSQSSMLSATFSGAGTLSFYYKVDSEGSYDKLRIYIDGENLDNYSGPVSWKKYEKELSDGNHTVAWVYAKDSSNSTGLDSAWIANVGFKPPVTMYTVMFEVNGGDSVSEPSRDVEDGAAIGTLPTAEWSGHTFLGWFTDSAGGDQIDATTTVSGDATYYAHWEEDAPPPDYATILGAPAGMSFASTGDKTWVDGGTVDGKAAVKSGDIGDSQSSMLSATFSGAGTLSFYYKVDSEGSYDKLRIYIDGENLDNYSGPVSWKKYEKELSDGNHTVAWVYAKDSSNSTGLDSAWIANVGFETGTTTYTVTFDKNGGDSVSETSRVVEEDMTVGIPLPTASWAGHTLDGWFTKASGGTQIDGTETVTGDVTYYAHWTEIETEYKTWTDPGTGIAWTYRVVDGEAEIYNDDNAAIPDTTAGAITVPSTLGGYPVTRIGDWAFDGCELLTSVTIPSGVTIIGEGAFSECYGLESVSLPEGLETIKDGAFQFCESLETVSIPSTVTSIGDGVFQDCDALADDDGFIVVSGILFDYNGAGGDITIPSTVKTIWDGALYYTASLTGVTIPGSVKTVGYDAFGDSANLASVTFGRGVKTIGEVAFIRCAALTEARIPASVTSIGESAFGETSLNKVYVEYGDTERVKALLEASYFDTTGVEFIEDEKPLVCTVTLELNGGSGVETSFDVEPGETIGLLPIPEGPEGQNGFQGWFWDSEFTDEVEPTDEVLGDCTCYAKWGGAIAIETTLVDGVAWSYFVDSKNKAVLYNNGRTVIPSDYEGALVIPSKIAGKSVVGIGERAFYGCTGLTSVIIPDGVNDINVKAFAWCESLQVVQFGKGVSKGTIFFDAFKGCEWLKAIDFKGTTPPTVANYSVFEDAGTMTLEGKPIVYVPKSAAKKWGSEWTGMRVMPYSYSANIVMSVRPGKETYGSITPVVSGKATEIGKKVALKAKASSKAYVFAGWYDLDTGLRVSRSASYSYLVTGEDKRFEADFVDVGTDIDSLGIDVHDVWTDDDGTTFIDIGAAVSSCSEPKITVKGLPSGLKYDSKTQKISGQSKKPGVYKVTVTASNLSQKKAIAEEFELVVPNWTCDAMPNLEPDPDDYGTIWCGVAFDNELVDCTPALGWTVKASGLPTGLKWTNKVVLDKKTGAVIAKANTIYGVPTKPGNYTVTFTATRLREKQTATITLKVVARPEWATGTFNGGTAIDGAHFGDAYTMLEGAGQATLTIAANGKISGKILEGGRTWTISAASFDHGDHGEYIAHVTAKSGKETRSETILLEMYGLNEVGGMVTASGDLGALVLYQTNWKADPWKTIAKNDAFKAAIKNELQYDRSDVEHGRSAYLSLKFAASGAVTVKGEFNIGGAVYKGSASATLVPLTEPDTTSNGAFIGEVCAYIPPKANKFAGYFERLSIKWNGTVLSINE